MPGKWMLDKAIEKVLNVEIKKGGISMKSLTRWDPFRMMSRWDPFEELRSMQTGLDELFNRFAGGYVPSERRTLWMPSVESYTKDGKLVFKAELPGIDVKDLDVSIADRELVIKGTRKAEKGGKEENYTYREIEYGSFERHFILPEGAKADELKAKFTNGILEITMPAPAVATTKKVEIEAPKEEKKVIETEAKKAA
jgi:HSP20 family protein